MTPDQYPNMTIWARKVDLVEEDGNVSSCCPQELAYHHINPILCDVGLGWIPPHKMHEDFADEDVVFQWEIEAYKAAMNDAGKDARRIPRYED